VPELPEVEVIRRDIEREFSGRRIRSVAVAETPNTRRVLRRHGPDELAEVVTGARIIRVGRVGKYLVLHLDGEWALVVHLGMSGQLLAMAGPEPIASHTHLVLELEEAGQLRFVDPRTFGEVFVARMGELGKPKELEHLGPDALGQPDGWAALSPRLAGRKMTLKSFLMDQRLICGVGNIYSDEILFAARLAPVRATNSLSPREERRLWRAIREVLQEAIRHRGTSIEDEQYRDLYGTAGGFRERLAVYGREGQPCPRCGAAIQRGRWSNRSNYFCPRCQV
jgi:formamidopyrimidine-DNA glycosylase